MNPLLESRRSIRKFKPTITVSMEHLNELMSAAMLAPSAHNNHPWEFIVVTNRDVLSQISLILPNAVPCKTAPAAIVLVALPKRGRLEGYYPQECGAAIQNILLQATDMELGSCWCGVWPVPVRITALQSLLDIAAHKVPFGVIAVGVPDETAPSRKAQKHAIIACFS